MIAVAAAFGVAAIGLAWVARRSLQADRRVRFTAFTFAAMLAVEFAAIFALSSDAQLRTWTQAIKCPWCFEAKR